ncbi:hypothetical protein K440DRAFT_197861 [Wilcoxina mikolae CBS 423.85]|nr:hypothetical protein K440DRAFT_197861 [Wilcoxina mikolae CBS 423.85]
MTIDNFVSIHHHTRQIPPRTRRLLYLPLAPADPHPDTGERLDVSRTGQPSAPSVGRQSYVQLNESFIVPLGLLQELYGGIAKLTWQGLNLVARKIADEGRVGVDCGYKNVVTTRSPQSVTVGTYGSTLVSRTYLPKIGTYGDNRWDDGLDRYSESPPESVPLHTYWNQPPQTEFDRYVESVRKMEYNSSKPEDESEDEYKPRKNSEYYENRPMSMMEKEMEWPRTYSVERARVDQFPQPGTYKTTYSRTIPPVPREAAPATNLCLQNRYWQAVLRYCWNGIFSLHILSGALAVLGLYTF